MYDDYYIGSPSTASHSLSGSDFAAWVVGGGGGVVLILDRGAARAIC